MSSSYAFNLLLLSIALLSVPCLSRSQPKTRPFILPIGKDSKTNFFYSPVGIGTPIHNMELVVDIGGPILWYDCDSHYNSSSYHPIDCDSKQCPLNRDFGIGCTGCNGPSKPGCSNNTCSAYTLNPLAPFVFSGDTGEDVLFLSRTKVSGLLTGCTESAAFSFVDSVPLTGLPKSSKGIIGLAKTKLALHAQLSSAFKLPHKFALCLPSSNKKGLGNLFIGGAPLSIPNSQNASNILFTIPLVVNPVSTAPAFTEGDSSYEYFITVNSIKIEGKVVNLKPSLLSIDKKGNGGTKISTMNPFTVLHSSIYKPLVREFVKQASDRKIKKVASLAPFEACFDFSTIGRTKTGLDVPTIELVLQGGLQWKIYGANSMVLVKKNVACLGFVDGGKQPRTSVVIGGHQLEDYLLVFDLDSSKLSFSSSLLLHNARCSSIRI